MARQRRLDPDQGIHHVYSRGTRQWIIFHDDIDRRRFMRWLSIVCERYEIEVLAYCLMGNHFHVVVRCTRGHLSDALRDLKSMYARSYNRRHKYTGPVWEGRFGSRVVAGERDLRDLIRYVHRNPLDADRSAPLSHHRWSSHAHYLGLRVPPSWMSIGPVLELFGNDADVYQLMVEQARPEDKVQNVVPMVTRSSKPTGRPEPEPVESLADIVLAVASAAGCDVADVRPRLRNGYVGVAIILALDYGGFLPSEIAEPLGYARGDNIVRAAKHSRRRVAQDRHLANVLDRAIQQLRTAAKKRWCQAPTL